MMARKKVLFDIASPKFKVLWDGGYRHYVFSSGRGTSKGHSIARYILWACNEYKTRVLCCRETQKSIRESSHRLFRDLIDKYMLHGIYEITDTEIRHKFNGSLITFSGLHGNVENVKSTEGVDICWVDEAQTVSQESIEILVPTIRVSNSILIWSLNPRLSVDPVYKTFVDAERSDTVVVKLELEDNKFLPDTLRAESDQMKLNDPEMWEWVYGGKCLGADEMTFIKPDIVRAARQRVAERQTQLKIYAGLDVAGMGADKTVLIRRQGGIILSIHKFNKGSTIDATEWVKTIYAEHPWDEIIIDATGSTGVADMVEGWVSKSKAFEVTKWVASRSSRRPTKYVNARTESWGLMKEWLQTIGQLTNDPEWDTLSILNYKLSGKECIALESKKAMKKSPDLLDALALSIWYNDETKTSSGYTMGEVSGYQG